MDELSWYWYNHHIFWYMLIDQTMMRLLRCECNALAGFTPRTHAFLIGWTGGNTKRWQQKRRTESNKISIFLIYIFRWTYRNKRIIGTYLRAELIATEPEDNYYILCASNLCLRNFYIWNRNIQKREEEEEEEVNETAQILLERLT